MRLCVCVCVSLSLLDVKHLSLSLCGGDNRMIDSSVNVRRSFVASPEKEDRYYTTRGSMGIDENGKVMKELPVKESKKQVWPKLFITLSNKEKEEDFLAMKGCKLPQRPKKRAKLVQKTLLVSLFLFFHDFLFIVDRTMFMDKCVFTHAAGESRCLVIRSMQREV